MRWCSEHKQEEPEEEFTPKGSACKQGKYEAHIRLRYGLLPDEYNAMMEAQDGLCAICQKRPAKYVDHCHETGKVRGILCPGCNTAIGQFEDDLDIINRAIHYLVDARHS